MKFVKFVLVLAFISLSSCTKKDKISSMPQQIEEQPKLSTTLTLNLYDRPRSLDPAKIFDNISNYLAQQIHRGLVEISPQGQLEPAIAKQWEISPDGKKYAFYLKEGVRFHNGREVEASDFVYSFTRILDPALNSPVADYFKKIKGALAYSKGITKKVEGLKAISKYILQIEMEAPYMPMIHIFTAPTASVVPKEEVESRTRNFGEHPIGAGPFIYEGYDKDRRKITLVSNEDYFETPPNLKKIECYILKDEDAYYRFKGGDLDYFRVKDLRFAEDLVKKGWKIYRSLQHGVAFIGFNHAHMPFSDRNVRLALRLALDRQSYQSKILKLNLEAADQFMPRDMFGRIDTSLSEQFNPKKAQKLVSKSLSVNEIQNETFELFKHSAHFNAQEDAFLEKSFLEVGLKVKVTYIDRPLYFKKWQSRDYNLIYLRIIPDISDPDNIMTYFHSEGSYNYFAYENPTVDYLIEAGRTVPDQEKRKKIYERLSQIIHDDVSVLPLYYYDEFKVLQPNVSLGKYGYVLNDDLYIVTKYATEN